MLQRHHHLVEMEEVEKKQPLFSKFVFLPTPCSVDGGEACNQLDKHQNTVTFGCRFYLLVHFITKGLIPLR